MAEDPEKKFQSIMDKLLFQSPSSSVGLRLSRGVKRPNQRNELAWVDPKSRGSEEALLSQTRSPLTQPSIYRPWDSGDLMRRLSTFKSMTWFAKPKVVNAVNCARRGWINVDMDIIACEVCGARILFSTPSSWSREQVASSSCHIICSCHITEDSPAQAISAVVFGIRNGEFVTADAPGCWKDKSIQ